MRTAPLVEALTVVVEGSEPDREEVTTIREALEDLTHGAALLGPDDVFGPAQAAAYMGVNRTTISRWKREGYMPEPWVDLGGTGVWTLWTREQLDDLKARHDRASDGAGRRLGAGIPNR